MFNVFIRPETHNLGFINGICEPPETVPNSLCVHAYVCFVLFAEGLDLQAAQFPSSESRCISVVLGKQFTRARLEVRREWGEGEVSSHGKKPFVLILP